jgi:hypothetical protein
MALLYVLSDLSGLTAGAKELVFRPDYKFSNLAQKGYSSKISYNNCFVCYYWTVTMKRKATTCITIRIPRNSHTAVQEILPPLRNPKFQFRIDKRLPLYSVLSQLNPVQRLQTLVSQHVFILSFHLRLALVSNRFHLHFLTTIIYEYLISPRVTAPPKSFSYL